MSTRKWFVRAGSLLVMLGFVLPVFSVSCGGMPMMSQSFSLAGFSSEFGLPYLYLVPIGALVVLVLAFLPSQSSSQVKGFYFGQVAGAVISLGTLLYTAISFASGLGQYGLQASPQIGLFVIIAGYILIGLGLFEQIPEIRAARGGYQPVGAPPPGEEYYPPPPIEPPEPYTPTPDVTPNGMLQVLEGEMTGSNIPIQVAKFRIGRGSDNELRIMDDKTVSRQHAHIRFADGMWYIQDQNSTTGTFVNKKGVRAQRIYPGDEIAIGDQKFVFYQG
jgi:hypothetical protein